jgi:hypothetical protein
MSRAMLTQESLAIKMADHVDKIDIGMKENNVSNISRSYNADFELMVFMHAE